jgi:hypothetical protein
MSAPHIAHRRAGDEQTFPGAAADTLFFTIAPMMPTM